MLILRIRQAECALADGRLDEAFEIAKSEDIARHRHGQRLIGRLTRALVQRGQANLAAGQLQPALADGTKAEQLAGKSSDIAQLQAAVGRAILKAQQGRQENAQRAAEAKQHMADGWLSVGERILKEAPDDDAYAERLRQELAAVRLQMEDAVAKARHALEQGDIEAAIEIARSAGIDRSRNDQVAELLRQIRGQVVTRVRADLEQGRIDRAQSFLDRLPPVGENGSEVGELRRGLIQCRQAAERIAAGQPAAALSLLRKVKTVCPSAKWLDVAITHVKRAAEALEELDASPLGLSLDEADAGLPARLVVADHAATARRDRRQKPQWEPQMPDTGGQSSLLSTFIMQMDGVGSFLVFRDARVTVGPVSSSARPMLGLIADPNTPVATLERVDGDYFIRSQTAIEVNGQSVTEKLLADGDRIALSPRCRLRFGLPNPASTTAVLTLSGARLGRPDVRQVILMDRDILVGPYTNNHIRTDQLSDVAAIFAQNGRLLCRAQDGVSVDGRPFDPSVGLTIDKRVEIGKLSMVVARLGE